MAQQEAMLSTTDNPYDPFDDWGNWYSFDSRHGYNSPGLLARVVVLSDELSESDQQRSIIEGIDEIVAYNLSGVHVKVERATK